MTRALSNPTYRRILLAQVFSIVGSGLTTIALALLAFELAAENAGVVLGIALGLKMVAYVGLAPVGAALAALFPRKPFLIGLDLARVLLVLLLPFVTQIWHIYALVFAFQACSAAFTPTFQATIPDILEDDDDYVQALSYARLTYDLESLLVPVLAGALLTITTFHTLFVGTSIGFVFSAILVASVSLPAQNTAISQLPFRKRLTRGTWIYLATPRLRGMLALYVAVAAATAMVIVNTVVFVKSELGLSDGAVAVYLGASGLGSMIVALALPRVLRNSPPRPLMLIGASLLTLSLGIASLEPGFYAGFFLWAALGVGAGLIQTPSGLIITRSCHKDDRPAVFAAQFALSHSAWLMAYPLAGFFGAWIDLSATFGIMAVLAAVSTILASRLWPQEDPIELEHEHPSETHEHAFGDTLHHEGDAVMAEHPNTHRHQATRHTHPFIIDDHHPVWPSRS